MYAIPRRVNTPFKSQSDVTLGRNPRWERVSSIVSHKIVYTFPASVSYWLELLAFCGEVQWLKLLTSFVKKLRIQISTDVLLPIYNSAYPFVRLHVTVIHIPYRLPYRILFPLFAQEPSRLGLENTPTVSLQRGKTPSQRVSWLWRWTIWWWDSSNAGVWGNVV